MMDIPLVLAQTVPTDPVGGIYDLLLNNGLLGAAVALLIFLLIRRDGELQKAQEGRLIDAKSLADIIKDHTVALTASNAAQDERNRALEVSSRASEKSAIIIDQLTKEVAGLNLEIKELKKRG